MKIYVAAVEVLRKKERKDETVYAPKLVEKLACGPVTAYCKIFILSYAIDGLLC